VDSTHEPGFRSTWPQALSISGSASLTMDGIDLALLADVHQTPLWVLSRSTMRRRYQDMLRALQRHAAGDVELAYSVKANHGLATIQTFNDLGARFDCSAEYEFPLTLAAGVNPDRCIVHGVGKSDQALALIATHGAHEVVVDSMAEVDRLQQALASTGRIVDCLVRVRLTYAELLEGDPDYEFMLDVGMGKFGVSTADGTADATIDAILAAPNLRLMGLHHHVGFSGYLSGYERDLEVAHHAACARELATYANAVWRRRGVILQRLNLGGGMRCDGSLVLSTPGGANDISVAALPTADDYAAAVMGALRETLSMPSSPTVEIELGAQLVNDAGVLVVRVDDIKDVAPRTTTESALRYVITDAGMWLFVNRLSMRVGHPVVRLADPLADIDEARVVVCGQVCVFDAVAEDIRLPPLERGDLLAYLHQGGYTETQSTQFNAFPRPATVLVDQGHATVVRRRETLDDLIARNV